MYALTHEYEIRLLDIQGLRSVMMSVIDNLLREWNKNHSPWVEDVESATDWIFKEMIEQNVRCKIVDHYADSELGRYLYDELKDLHFHFIPFLELIHRIIQSRVPKHMKVMVVGSTILIAVLYR